MKKTSIGKIGRLPKDCRDELGRRIENGEPGQSIVKWLNDVPAVQTVLKDQFEGHPVTGQNLSLWKQTGHPRWLASQESSALVKQLVQHADALETAAGGREISECFSRALSVQLAHLAGTLLAQEGDPETRWNRLCQVHRELSLMRRDEHRAVDTRLKQERWEQEVVRWERQTEQEDAEAKKLEKEARKTRLRGLCLAPLQKIATVARFGGGQLGEAIADMLHRIDFDLPLSDPPDPAATPSSSSSPSAGSKTVPSAPAAPAPAAPKKSSAPTPAPPDDSKLIQPNPS